MNQDTALEQTPEVFNENYSVKDLSVSSRYGSSLIEDLIKEARSKDLTLDTMLKSLERLPRLKSASFEDWRKYQSNSRQFLNEAKRYANSSKDTAQALQLAEMLNEMEQRLEERTNSLQALDSLSISNTAEMADELIKLKLFIAAGMMENYLSNELPKTEDLQGFFEQQESILEQLKARVEDLE